MRKVEKIKIVCLQCKKDTFVLPSRVKKFKFCTRSCQGKFHVNKYPERFKRDMTGENHPLYGKKRRPESIIKSVENHPYLKYGLTPEHTRQRKWKEYIIWKNNVLIKGNSICAKCGSKENIVADHIKPFALYPELRLDENNGQCLCKICHTLKNSEDMKLIRKEAKYKWEK